MDSTVALWKIKKDYARLYTLTFTYGSKDQEVALVAARKISELAGAIHLEIDLQWLRDFSKTSGSALLSQKDIPTPEMGELDNLEKSRATAEKVWVPARNLVFLSIAASLAESLGGEADIVAGFDREEAETFPDNTAAFVDRVNQTLEYALLKKGVQVTAPLIDLDKKEIAKTSLRTRAPVEYTCSCYMPLGFDKEKRPIHCGLCESCKRRKRGFRESGVSDPTIYQA